MFSVRRVLKVNISHVGVTDALNTEKDVFC
jgi:hypothetical protein